VQLRQLPEPPANRGFVDLVRHAKELVGVAHVFLSKAVLYLRPLNSHAQALGRMGGVARAQKLSKKRRKEIAMMGVAARQRKVINIPAAK
jgi:hypothetical protein